MNVARNGFLVLAAALAIAWSAAPSAGQMAPAQRAALGDTLRLTPSTAAESLLTAPITEPGERWTLTQAIETALQHNSDVHVARARTKQASGSALAAWNGILPSLITSLDYNYFKPDRNTIFTGQVVDTNTIFGSEANARTTTFNATLSSNILSFPAIGEKQRQDRLHRGSELDESETRNNVVYQVKQQYFEVLKAVRLAEVARQTEQLARDEETRSEALFQVGTVARGDVLKARARRATTTGDRIHAENQIDIQASRLRQILGVSPGMRIIPESALDMGIVMPDSSESVKQALATRPRLESAKAVEQAAHSGLTSAQTLRLPKVDGSFGWQHQRNQQSIENITGIPNPPTSLDFEQTNNSWQGNVRASLPIFEGFLIEGNVRQAKGALLEAEANRRQREIDVAVEVQQAWLNLRESVEQIDVAREGLASAEEDYKFSKGRYDLGAGTYLDLLTAEVNLANAKQTLISAVADARIAEAGLEFSIGSKQY